MRRSKNGCPAFVGKSAVVTHSGDPCRAAGLLPIAMRSVYELDHRPPGRVRDFRHGLCSAQPWFASSVSFVGPYSFTSWAKSMSAPNTSSTAGRYPRSPSDVNWIRFVTRSDKSSINSYAEPWSRGPVNHDTISLLSASSTVHVHASPASAGPSLARPQPAGTTTYRGISCNDTIRSVLPRLYTGRLCYDKPRLGSPVV